MALGAAVLLGRRRRRRGQEPSQRAEANRLEVGYVTLLVAIVAFLVVSSFRSNAQEFPTHPQPAVRVQVTAFQWCWRFRSTTTRWTSTSRSYRRPRSASSCAWNFAYEELFWFYGHPVVYVMFFPFVGCVAEALVTFTGRRFFGYKGTVLSLLVFAAGSMAVWGHHLFASGQEADDYFSLTSIFLTIPAGVEYFGFLGTLFGGRFRYTTSMLFALAFIPQFLVGGLTGILVANPTIDYQVNNSYFVLGHFHYTLFAGSVFGFFAGFYLWFPKATGIMLRERLGKLHFVLLVIGANTTFIPFFFLGYDGMPRWLATYPAGAGFTTLSLISSIGAGIIGLAMTVFAYNLWISARVRVPAPPDPWGGQTLEWATSSPPPRFNFSLDYPVPPVRSYAPLLDLRQKQLDLRPKQSAGPGEG